MKSWRRQALFQGRHCFFPTPTLGGRGGSIKEAGTHSPSYPQYQLRIYSLKNLRLALALTLVINYLSARVRSNEP